MPVKATHLSVLMQMSHAITSAITFLLLIPYGSTFTYTWEPPPISIPWRLGCPAVLFGSRSTANEFCTRYCNDARLKVTLSLSVHKVNPLGYPLGASLFDGVPSTTLWLPASKLTTPTIIRSPLDVAGSSERFRLYCQPLWKYIPVESICFQPFSGGGSISRLHTC